MRSKAVNSTGSIEYFTGDLARESVTRYMVIDPNGDTDEVLHRSWIAAVESLLDLGGIGDELEAEMRAEGVRPILGCCPTAEDEEAQSNWIWGNQGYIKDLLLKHDYKILPLTKWKDEL